MVCRAIRHRTWDNRGNLTFAPPESPVYLQNGRRKLVKRRLICQRCGETV